MNEPSNIIEALDRVASVHAGKVAFAHLRNERIEQAMTFAELRSRTVAVAAKLQALGMSGGRVLLLYPAGIDFVCAFLGAIFANVVPVPAVPPHSRRAVPQLRAIMDDAEADLILTSSELAPRVDELMERDDDGFACRLLETDAITPELARLWERPELSPDSLAFLQYTSGSTSAPKGVKITHGNVLHNLRAIRYYLDVSERDRFLTWLPHYHDMGLIGMIINPMSVGATTYILSPASFIKRPDVWLRAISEHRITLSGAPNFAYQMCVDRISDDQLHDLDLSSWTCAFCGAEPVRGGTMRGFAEKFSVCGFSERALSPTYGMAEATLIVTGIGRYEMHKELRCDKSAYVNNTVVPQRDEGSNCHELVSCGRVSELVPVVVVEPGARAAVEPLRIGEICIGGDAVSAGCYGQRAHDTVVPEGASGSYLRTGDLGFVDSDGHLYVTGRIKDVIKIAGRCYHPQDIELAAIGAHEALTENRCIAFGIETDAGEEVALACELDRKHARRTEFGDIVQAVTSAVAESHLIEVSCLVLLPPGGLMRTSSGKLRRAATKTAFLEGELDTVHVWRAPQGGVTAKITDPTPRLGGAEDLEEWLKHRLTIYVGVETEAIDSSEHLACYGVDSTIAIQLTGDLSSALGKDVDPTLLWELPTIEKLTRGLADLVGDGQGRA